MTGKRITMQEVAERAGVSRTTVSFVLNNTPNANISPQTRERIWQAARELNYARDFAAHSLATGRSHTIAFILRQPSAGLIVDAFIGGLLSGVSQAISQKDYHVLFYTLSPDAPQGSYETLIRSQRVDGLLISGPITHDPELDELSAEGVPIVVQGTPGDQLLPSVDINNHAAAAAAVQHLLDLGHRQIAHITNGPLAYTSSRDRLAGYRAALENAGIAYNPGLVQVADFTPHSGFMAMQRLLAQKNRFTAVLIASDVVALGAVQALRIKQKRIPEDVSIISFDDIPFADYLHPRLTAIHPPTAALGKAAGSLLMQLIAGQKAPAQPVLLPAEIIKRDSTAPLPS